MNQSIKRAAFLAIFLFIMAAFYLFTYNSGYGYDALEYLNIARSMLGGYSFFSFIPAKSWLFYYMTASFLPLVGQTHQGVALLITMIYGATLITTYLILRKSFNARVAVLSSILVGTCSFFMELNFLEPEGLVYLFGLLGFYSIINGLRGSRKRDLILGGFWLGLGMSFKVVAAFYIVAVVASVFFWEFFRIKKPVVDILRTQACICLGALIALALPLVYFLVTGRSLDYLKWTYYFPLFKYPSKTIWLYKLYSKLLWFWVLLAAAFVVSMRKKIRSKLYANLGIWLVFSMGLFSFIPLLKVQASHFVFPGAAFLSIYIAYVFDQWISEKRGLRGRAILMSMTIAVSLTLCLSVYLYRPNAFKRFFTIKDYSQEETLKHVVQRLVPKDKKVIFFRDSVFLYWLCDRYPNLPFFNFDIQASYWIEEHPNTFLNVLNDPDLVLVEFNPDSPDLYDRLFLQKAKNRVLMGQFYELLKTHFVVYDAGIAPYTFWVRRGLKMNMRKK